MTTADVDNDGDSDVLIATGPNHANSLWLNNGQGRFTLSDQDLNGVLASNGFMVGDLNGDGFPDLYECSWQRPDAVWLNDGKGRFVITQTGQKLRSRRAGLQDFDGDGDLDVFVTNEVNLPNAVCLNNGDGTLTLPIQFLGNSATADVALADFDGDGDIDAFTANAGSAPNRVWLNTSIDHSAALSSNGLPNDEAIEHSDLTLLAIWRSP